MPTEAFQPQQRTSPSPKMARPQAGTGSDGSESAARSTVRSEKHSDGLVLVIVSVAEGSVGSGTAAGAPVGKEECG